MPVFRETVPRGRTGCPSPSACRCARGAATGSLAERGRPAVGRSRFPVPGTAWIRSHEGRWQRVARQSAGPAIGTGETAAAGGRSIADRRRRGRRPAAACPPRRVAHVPFSRPDAVVRPPPRGSMIRPSCRRWRAGRMGACGAAAPWQGASRAGKEHAFVMRRRREPVDLPVARSPTMRCGKRLRRCGVPPGTPKRPSPRERLAPRTGCGGTGCGRHIGRPGSEAG